MSNKEIEDFYRYAENQLSRYKRPKDYIERYKRVEERLRNKISKPFRLSSKGEHHENF